MATGAPLSANATESPLCMVNSHTFAGVGQAQLVTASDRHAADEGLIPPGWQGIFLPRVNFQCRLSFSVHTSLRAIACINICAHIKDPVVYVRVRWIMATQTYQACTISDKNNQVDNCGCSTERRRRRSSGHCCKIGLLTVLCK